MKDPALIVLRALLYGMSVELDGVPFEMHNGKICYKMFSKTDGGTKDVVVEVGITLNGFIHMCRKLPEEKLALLSGQVTMIELRRSQKSRREDSK
jgi:hypothetical protein